MRQVTWCGIVAVLLAGCGSGAIAVKTIPAGKLRSSTAVTQQGSTTKCQANLDFPLCPLPLPGFREAQKAIVNTYMRFTEPPRHEFNLQSEDTPSGKEPDHIVVVQYGAEHSQVHPCEDEPSASVATVRGDKHALVCEHEGVEPAITADFAFWKEMGTTWEAMISTFNGAKPYPLSMFVKIINGWSVTGDKPLSEYR
jgi:hypothetical protein